MLTANAEVQLEAPTGDRALPKIFANISLDTELEVTPLAFQLVIVVTSVAHALCEPTYRFFLDSGNENIRAGGYWIIETFHLTLSHTSTL